MSLSDAQIRQIVDRLDHSADQTEHGCALDGGEHKTVVLIPDYVPVPKKALASLGERYGEDFVLLFLDDTVFEADGVRRCRVAWPEQKGELVELLVRAEHAVLLSPGVSLLKRLANGQEEDGAGEILLRRVLWGKPVDVLLDFDPPKFRRGTYFAQIAEAVDNLVSMGVGVFAYSPCESQTANACSLVTERDVIDAKQSGQKTILCVPEAIVTPLAADTAKELQINIERV
jgi:hypothetical protein